MTLPFRAKHALGQHFIRDAALLTRMVEQTPLMPEDGVFEIGPGLGDLTRVLSARARRVLALEVDRDLVPLLQHQFADQPHVEIRLGDVMEADLSALLAPLGAFHVIANLPYYLTTPILMLLLRLPLPILSICVTVQLEAAQRVLAQPSSKEYGPLAIFTQYNMQPLTTMPIPRGSFTPPPNVESVFLVLQALESPPVEVAEETAFRRLVQTSFAMRRKTLVNNLINAYSLDREQAQQVVATAGLPLTIRPDAMTLQEFARLDACLAGSR